MQYVLNYLNSKTYINNEHNNRATGYLDHTSQEITVFPKFFDIKNKENQNDWLQTIAILKLIELDAMDVGGFTIFFHVPKGKEKEWEQKFEKHDMVEWAELNYIAEIVPAI